MHNHRWRMTRWPRRIVVVILPLLIVTGGVVFCNLNFSKDIDGQADSMSALPVTTPIESTEIDRNMYRKEEVSFWQRVIHEGWTPAGDNRALRDNIWRLAVGILPENGYSQVANGMALLRSREPYITKIVAEEEAYYASTFITDIWKHSFEKVSDLTLSDEVEVILYHTHNAETYLPDAGVSKVTGQNGGVVQAAKVFQETLQKKYGVRTAHSTTIHDYPDWSRAYQNSLTTAKQLLQAYPTTKAIFDVHRDAGFTSKQTTTTTIQGRSAAKIMMVIGCNHDNWQENLAFARLLEAKCNELYPGLLRDKIHIKETGRYNQQVNAHAVLLEIGSDLNTQAEADYSMECFAHVVYEVLKDLKQQQ